MTEAKQLLKKYWKHDSFRKPQEEIINSVLNGNDTLALLPTGGGKSICYQVPGMLLNGITLVVSPLIALIKDQVENLQKEILKPLLYSAVFHKRRFPICLIIVCMEIISFYTYHPNACNKIGLLNESNNFPLI